MRLKFVWLRGGVRPAARVLREVLGFIPQDLLDWEDFEVQGELIQLPLDGLPKGRVVQALHRAGLVEALQMGGMILPPMDPAEDEQVLRWAEEKGVPVWGLPKGEA